MAVRKKINNTTKLVGLFIAIILTIAINYLDLDNALTNNNITEPLLNNVVSTDLQVYFIDVGQADSILIANNDNYMLIDAGNNEDGDKLVKFLKNQGIKKFNYVIGTHPHEDHIGGLDNVINNFEIDKIYLPDVTTTTKSFDEVINSLEDNNLSITIPKVGETFELGEAKLKVLYSGTDSEELNNSSIVVKMVFGDYSYLFTGDATSKIEEMIINEDIDVDVLKVAHHGSPYSTTPKFISKVKPKYAIISVGKENNFGHPSQNIINRIKLYTDKIYCTDELGTIVFNSNGKDIEVYNYKTDTNGE